MSTGLKANSDGSAAIQVGGTDVITLTSGGAATFVTSPTTVQAGTAAAPSITFSGDTNTGIYSPGADQVAIATGGSQRAVVDASGNLGVNLTPSAAQGRLQLNGAGQSWFKFYDSTAGWNFGTFYKANGTSALGYFGGGGGSAIAGGTVDDFVIRAEGALLFAAGGGTERARFNDTGAFVLAGGTTTANGIGITFPATQSASSNANTLDDYEEGTWTPAIAFGGASVGVTYDARAGNYTKIGRVVHFWCQMNLSSKGSSTGSITITGLPFTASDTGQGWLRFSYNASLPSFPVVTIDGGGTALIVRGSPNNMDPLTNANIAGTAQIQFAGFYYA